jgi:acyl carrier protein
LTGGSLGTLAVTDNQKHPLEGTMSVEAKIKQIIVEQLQLSAEEVTPEASFIEDLGADSLDLTELIMAFEEAFGVEIADEDAQKILKVKDAIEFVQRKQA